MTEQATNNNNLQSGNTDDIIQTEGETQAQETSAGGSTPEETDVIRNLIAQKDAQIALLQDELKKSQENWAQAIRQGAAIGSAAQTDGTLPVAQPVQSLSEDYVPLREMDFSFSKKDVYKK